MHGEHVGLEARRERVERRGDDAGAVHVQGDARSRREPPEFLGLHEEQREAGVAEWRQDGLRRAALPLAAALGGMIIDTGAFDWAESRLAGRQIV